MSITGKALAFDGDVTPLRRFFSSYQRVDAGWNYVMGNFAQMSLPLADSVTLTVQRVNSKAIETFSVSFGIHMRDAIDQLNGRSSSRSHSDRASALRLSTSRARLPYARATALQLRVRMA